MSGLGKWFAVSSDGQMSGAEMLRELQKDKVCPVMCFEEDGETIVPIFPSTRLAEQFAKRNTPRDYIIGTMEAFQDNLTQLEERGYKVVEINWPKKRATTVAALHMDNREVETENCGYRRTSDK